MGSTPAATTKLGRDIMSNLKRVCAVCGCPQFPSPSGYVCRNGHGGADYTLAEIPDYESQYTDWYESIKEQIVRYLN